MNIAVQINKARLAGSKRLNLSCGLEKFPVEIFDLADTLEILDLSGNHLSSLPDDLWKLSKLRILFCSNNNFTRLPDILGKCSQLSMVGFKANKINHVSAASLGKSLRWLILTDNQIGELPNEIGHCSELQKLMLSGNKLSALPETLSQCKKLELLRIAANQFSSLPPWLFTLPRLAWLAFAGNPFCESVERIAHEQSPILTIPWHQFELHQQLGEGASGVIHQAKLTIETKSNAKVAIKLFKGDMTSDGLPHNEMAACISAGTHPNLITIHGKIADHPAGNAALVMSLIDPEFRNLAAPPSLESCTRDIYDDNTVFSINTVLRIAYGIASATHQLHNKSILHGDLYAHNILYNAEGDCLLGDFGAASFFPQDDPQLALSLQRIEVRAFGCLLEELLERCEARSESINMLENLKTDCLNINSAKRPLFPDIVQTLMVFLA